MWVSPGFGKCLARSVSCSDEPAGFASAAKRAFAPGFLAANGLRVCNIRERRGSQAKASAMAALTSYKCGYREQAYPAHRACPPARSAAHPPLRHNCSTGRFDILGTGRFFDPCRCSTALKRSRAHRSVRERGQGVQRKRRSRLALAPPAVTAMHEHRLAGHTVAHAAACASPLQDHPPCLRSCIELWRPSMMPATDLEAGLERVNVGLNLCRRK
jgi:hypothetical protein